jgi:hypothetical protein
MRSSRVSSWVKRHRSLHLERSIELRIQTLLVAIFTLLLAQPRIGVLTRFPNEDLYWNDLQLLNSWRWLSESIRVGGISSAMSGTVDFRQNTGFMFAADAKWPSQFIDIGAWFTFIFHDTNIAYNLKFTTFALLAAGSIYNLIQQNPLTFDLTSARKLVFFGILYSSLILHPVLFGEVGPLNQIYLLLIPCWFEYLKNLNERLSNNRIGTFARLIVLTFASLGSSDLFFISTISAVFLAFYLRYSSSLKKLTLLFKTHLLILAIFLLDKSYYISNKLHDDFLVASSGTWAYRDYWELFLKPAITRTVLYPEFAGPSTIFINFLVLALALTSLIKNPSREFSKWFLSIITTFCVFGFLGLSMHAIQEIRVNLPSAIRYHLTFFPFLLISVIASYANLQNNLSYRILLNKYLRKSLSLIAPFLAVVIVLFSSTSTYGGRVSDYYAVKVDRDLGNWYQKSLPECINGKISVTSNSIPRSFMLVKKSNTENLMDDSLVIIGEQPGALQGRTFNQWRYSSGVLLNSKLSEIGKSGLFSRPFLPTEPLKIVKFSQDFMIPYILSTERLTGNAFEELGQCYFPSKFRSTVAKNDTLGATIYIYYISEWKVPTSAAISSGLFSSSIATFDIDCNRLSTDRIVSIPINYNDNLRPMNRDSSIVIEPGKLNSLRLDLSGECKNNSIISIKITSHSNIIALKNFSYITIVVLLITLIIIQKFRLRRVVIVPKKHKD